MGRKRMRTGVLALTLSTAVVAGPAAIAAVGTPGRADVVVATAEAGKRAFFADLVRLHDGRLLAVYREGAQHTGQDGRILGVQSDDGGHTWSTPRVIMDSPLDDRDPKIFQAADGTILVNFFETDWNAAAKLPVGTFVTRSADGGTWSTPIKVGTHMRYTGGPDGGSASHGPVVQTRDGELLVPLYGTLPGRTLNSATVVRSTDGGRTWPVATEAVVAEGGVDDGATIGFQEPVLSVLPSGQTVNFVRSNEAGVGYLTRSFDRGRTWTDPDKTTIPASSHHLLRLSTGGILLTYGDISRKRSAGRPTAGRIIRNPQRDWDAQPPALKDILLYDASVNGPAPTDDQANPSSAEVAPGRFLTLTSDPYTKQIVGVYSRTSDYVAH